MRISDKLLSGHGTVSYENCKKRAVKLIYAFVYLFETYIKKMQFVA